MHASRSRVFATSLAAAAAALVLLAAPGSAAPPPPGFAPAHVFVAASDTANGNVPSVFEFDAEHVFVRKFAVDDPSGVQVFGIAFGPDGNLYCGLSAGRVVRVAPDLSRTTILDASDGLSQTVGVAFGGMGRLYACNREFGGSVVVSDLAGNPIGRYTPKSGFAPSWVSVGHAGHVFVSMRATDGTASVHELDADLRPVGSRGEGSFGASPGTPVIAPDGSMFVPDYFNGDVKVFDSEGGGPTSLSVKGLSQSYGAALGPGGALYAANYDSDSVVMIDLKTQLPSGSFHHDDMQFPAGIAVAPYRYSVSVSGTAGGADLKARAVKKLPMTLSVSPESGVCHLVHSATAPLPAVMTFSGRFVATFDGTSFAMHAWSVEPQTAKRSTASLFITGSIAADAGPGETRPEKFAGTLQFASTGLGGAFTVAKPKLLP